MTHAICKCVRVSGWQVAFDGAEEDGIYQLGRHSGSRDAQRDRETAHHAKVTHSV